jgi:hypothetical protein
MLVSKTSRQAHYEKNYKKKWRIEDSINYCLFKLTILILHQL